MIFMNVDIKVETAGNKSGCDVKRRAALLICWLLK
jgi:hypothetical protein